MTEADKTQIIKLRAKGCSYKKISAETGISENSIKSFFKAVLQEMEVVSELTRKYIMENSRTVQNQDEYNAHYNALVERYEKLQKKSFSLQKQKEERLAKRDLIGGFIVPCHAKRKKLTCKIQKNTLKKLFS